MKNVFLLGTGLKSYFMLIYEIYPFLNRSFSTREQDLLLRKVSINLFPV